MNAAPHPSEPVFRNDALAKVTGRARYADDLTFPGMLRGVPVFSENVCGDNLKVDTRRAGEAPGVVRILTWKDVPGSLTAGQIVPDYPLFVSRRIRSRGDVAALVIAETETDARRAAALVEVTADPLPPLLSPEAALAGGAREDSEFSPGNRVNRHRIRRGDPEGQWESCSVIIEETFRTPRVEHAYMEPECGIAVPGDDEILHIYGSIQHPFSTRRFISAYLGLPFARIEIHHHPVGGAFGGKDDTASVICARAALGALLTGRPVKITATREESFRESYKRNPYRMDYRMGFSPEGRLLAVRADILADSGAYTSTTPWSTWRSAVQCCGPYGADHVRADVTGVHTNNLFSGAMRGFGAVQVNFAVEQVMDMAAEKLGMDPLELRRKNFVPQGGETVTGQVLEGHKVSLEEVMDRTAREIGFREKLKQCSYGGGTGEELYGIGLAVCYRGASVGAEALDFAACTINGQFDGSLVLETGIFENGQGAETAMILRLAEELGVRRERIVYRHPTTSTIPDSGTTVATRGTIMGSSAVVLAAEKLKKLLGDNLAPLLGCRQEDLRFREDRIHGPGSSLSWEEAMKHLYRQQVFPYVFAEYRAPGVTWNEETGQGKAYFTYVYSGNAVELTVNRKTGKVTLRNIVAVHDIGRAQNRGMVLGQIYGGIAQGAGMALWEDLKINEGKLETLNFDRYRIPRAGDLPEITAVILENPDPTTPSGLKGIGEPATEILAPAIANALYRATGKRPLSLPARPEGAAS